MTKEVENTRVALGAMNQALERLGGRPITDNPFFNDESLPGRLVYLMKAPPLRFEFGF